MSMTSANRTATRLWRSALVVLTTSFVAWSGDLFAQQKAHYLFNARQPVGEIGRMQLARRPELVGVFQPVLLRVPPSAAIFVAEGEGFHVAEADAALVSLQVGETYRLKVSNVPNRFGDVYPTVELLDRMHAPQGKEIRYPIPVELTAEDLGLALSGKYVTRVIYVEDPQRALPARELPQQRYLDAMAHEDPLHLASSIGRPVAILRMGSLAPDGNGPSAEFLFGSPPFQRHDMMSSLPYKPSEWKSRERPTEPIPREPVPGVPAAEDESVKQEKVEAPEAETPAEPPEDPSPNDQPDATSDPDPFDLPDTSAPDNTGDPFDEPVEDNLGEEDPFADDI